MGLTRCLNFLADIFLASPVLNNFLYSSFISEKVSIHSDLFFSLTGRTFGKVIQVQHEGKRSTISEEKKVRSRFREDWNIDECGAQ